MSESSYKNEFLFVLGNGASIASADPRIEGFIKKKPSIENFINVMDEINRNRGNFKLQRLLGGSITDISYNQCIDRIIEILKEKKETGEQRKLNVSELLDMLIVEGRNDDIDKLIIAIFRTVISYYKNIHDEYFFKLWGIVRKTKSSIVSLNWDANFERVIHKSLEKETSMKDFYGQFMLGHLIPIETNKPYEPVVEILKPHGSLNWHFNRSELGGKIDGLVISDSIYDGYWIDEGLHANSFLIPPVVKEKWENWHGYRPRMIKIRDDINRRIRECVASTRTLVIIGYSFPPEDKHIEELFIGNRLKNVWVYDTCEEVFQRINGYFSQAKCEFKKGGFAEIMDWPDVGEGFKPSRSK